VFAICSVNIAEITRKIGISEHKTMVTPAWVTTVSNWLPVIQLAGVILLLKYVADTAAIKKATAAIKMATLQPLLVLDQELRDRDDQILSQSHRPTPTTLLAGKLLVRNIGTGPAYDIVYTFDCVDGIRTLRSSTPYLKPDQGIEPAISKSLIKRGDIKFEATYSSLASVRFQSRQVISDGVLGSITVKKLGIFRKLFAFLKLIKLEIDAKIEERRTRKRIAASYPH
jgi:hypothetical protein